MNEATVNVPTIADIRAWVESVPGDEVVGSCGIPEHCLVARSYERLNPGLTFEVFPSSQGIIARVAAYSEESVLAIEEHQLGHDLNTVALNFDAGWDGGNDVTAAEVLSHWDELVAR